MNTRLEHLNITVSDPDRTAGVLCQLFGWKIRWQGSSIHGGRSVHVGARDSYLAIYHKPGEQVPNPGAGTYAMTGGLNHVGVVVDDLEAVEARVKAAGYQPRSHADHEPGRRFYFNGEDNIEYEVVTYD